MKILFYNHTNRVSGAERVLLLILSRLNRSRFDAVLLCPPGGELQKEAHSHGVSSVDVQALSARFTWKPGALLRYLLSFQSTVREARARVREYQPDVIHANSVRAGLVISSATVGLGIPIVWHVHDLLPAHPLSNCIRWFVLVHPPARIVVVAKAAADRFRGKLLRRYRGRIKLKVVYNAIDAAKLFSKDGHLIRKELRLRNDDKLIGIVGNLSPVKGQLELVRAFAAIRKQLPDAALLIVGSSLFNQGDGYQKKLQAEVCKLKLEPHVRFLGQRDDVPAIMAALNLLVLNSRSEAFPLVALEGMAAEVPVLATAVGGLPELINSQENGWLIPFGDKGKLIEAMHFLLHRPGLSGDLGKRARKHVIAKYPVSKFISRIESIYAELEQKRVAAPNEQLALSSST